MTIHAKILEALNATLQHLDVETSTIHDVHITTGPLVYRYKLNNKLCIGVAMAARSAPTATHSVYLNSSKELYGILELFYPKFKKELDKLGVQIMAVYSIINLHFIVEYNNHS